MGLLRGGDWDTGLGLGSEQGGELDGGCGRLGAPEAGGAGGGWGGWGFFWGEGWVGGGEGGAQPVVTTQARSGNNSRPAVKTPPLRVTTPSGQL